MPYFCEDEEEHGLRTLNYERAIVQKCLQKNSPLCLRTLNYERAIVRYNMKKYQNLSLRTLNYERAIVQRCNS